MAAGTQTGQKIAHILAGSWRRDPGRAEDVPGYELAEVSEILVSTGSAGLAYRRLGSERAGQRLKVAAQAQQLTHLLQKRAILAISTELADLGVPYLFFKGWVAGRDYHDPACRPTGDVDFLVDPKALDDVLRHFWGLSGEDWSPELGNVVGFSCKGVPDAIILDVHESLEKNGLDAATTLLESLEYSEFGERCLPHLDDARHLRQLCAHGLTHGFWRPLWLCDIAAFVEARGARVDWHAVSEGSAVFENWVGLCLGLSRSLLGTDVSSAPKHLRTVIPPDWVMKSVLSAWGKNFSSYHDRASLGFTWSSCPWRLPRELWLRRPNTLTATAQMGWRIPGRRTPLVTVAYLAYRARAALRN